MLIVNPIKPIFACTIVGYMQSLHNIGRSLLSIWKQCYEVAIVIVSEFAKYFALWQVEISSRCSFTCKKTPRKLSSLFCPHPFGKYLFRLSWPQLRPALCHATGKRIITSPPKRNLIDNPSFLNPYERMAKLVMNDGFIRLKITVVCAAKHKLVG